MAKTLRLSYPQWQGGVNPNYYAGSQILSWLVPENASHKKVTVPVATNFEDSEIITDGVSWKEELLKQHKAAYEIIKEEKPDRIITLGGDCSVEQAPIDYLHGRYPEDTGLIWIDAHPDFSDPGDFSHEHAMVLANLLGGGAPDFSAMVEHPFQVNQVIYAGLVEEGLETWEREHYKKYPIAYSTPEDLQNNNDKVLDWISENGYKHIIIHWDLDSLTPEDFYSLLCNEPHLPPVEYAVGKMRLDQIIGLIRDISSAAEVVGLGITEFMPWDIIRLKKALGTISIFSE